MAGMFPASPTALQHPPQQPTTLLPTHPSSSYTPPAPQHQQQGGGGGTPQEAVRGHLEDYVQLTKTLLDAVLANAFPSATTTAVEPTKIMQQLLEKDHSMLAAVTQLRDHQVMQQKIQRVQAQIASKDHIILQLAQQLKQAESILLDVVRQCQSKLQPTQQGVPVEMRPVDVDSLVAYANRISYSTSAPPHWNMQDPLGQYLTPAPQDDKIRVGLYYKLTERLPAEQQAPPPQPLTLFAQPPPQQPPQQHTPTQPPPPASPPATATPMDVSTQPETSTAAKEDEDDSEESESDDATEWA
eukprot:TRINITY_DN2554_c0_g1_i4.p1 TRINITY_DN2554_c0_g1~~TRINITY_DN2554_c0_g1_i4.p1  ORF type:complete len:299 (+),score=90.34 TRINITY_DN2554_c0_g1_i4:56-952(+)